MSAVLGQAAGLRERKKAKTRAAIRQHALRLFREQGYSATTVEQIAAAAEVSPATFYRYFPAKEDAILQDDLDLLAVEAFEAQPPDLGPAAAFRAALATLITTLTPEDMARFRETTELTLSVPELRARALGEFMRTIQMIAGALAKRAGRDACDPAVRNLAGAAVGVIMAAVMDPGEDFGVDMFARIDASLAHLEAGLPL
jgi:AcrR family transcriptional regulator